MIGHAENPPGVQVGLDPGPIQAAGERIAAVGFFRRPAFLLSSANRRRFCNAAHAEEVVQIQEPMGAFPDDFLAAVGQIAFVIEVGDFLARRLDLGVLHLRGNDQLVVDGFPFALPAGEIGELLLRRFAALDVIPSGGLDVAQYRFDSAQIGRRGALTELLVGLHEFRSEFRHATVEIVDRHVAGALRQRGLDGAHVSTGFGGISARLMCRRRERRRTPPRAG